MNKTIINIHFHHHRRHHHHYPRYHSPPPSPPHPTPSHPTRNPASTGLHSVGHQRCPPLPKTVQEPLPVRLETLQRFVEEIFHSRRQVLEQSHRISQEVKTSHYIVNLLIAEAGGRGRGGGVGLLLSLTTRPQLR